MTSNLEWSLDQFVKEIRNALVRFSSLHLHEHADAEDVVQEALTALALLDAEILKTIDPKRYVFGILKNKIADKIRIKTRHEILSLDDLEEGEVDALLFNREGHWLSDVAPAQWVCPEEKLRSDQFFKVVDICVNNLPTKVARVFSMKEFLDYDTQAICQSLGISQQDYWKCMSRARKTIQLCINMNWFDSKVLP
jgi:RNA polymerase sigma-70 factor, ECF subfamily